MPEEAKLRVEFQSAVFPTRIPFRYRVMLFIDGVPTGVGAEVWGMRKAKEMMAWMATNGNELVNRYGKVDEVFAAVMEKRREVELSKLKVGDKVRLWVDLGIYKKGRVCTVVEVEEPSFYVRGAAAYNDQRFPIKVVPVSGAGEAVLGTKEGIPLAMGEFGPLNEEVPE